MDDRRHPATRRGLRTVALLTPAVTIAILSRALVVTPATTHAGAAPAPTPATVAQATTTSSSTATSDTTETSSAPVLETSTTTTTTLDSTTVLYGPPPPPPPVVYQAVNATPVSGDVLVELPGSHEYVSLAQARQIPVGAFVDARGGTVAIDAASTTAGQEYTGNFTAGVFQLLQSRGQRGLTELALMDTVSRRRACASVGKGRKASLASSKKVSSKVLGLLKSTDNGRFSTRGDYSTATVRGTQYSVEDTCAGTLTTVTRGSVVVDYVRRHHQRVVVTAGHEFLAKASGARSAVVRVGH